MWGRFQSTKWTMTVYIGIIGTISLFVDKLDGGQWLALMISLSTSYTLANIAGDKLSNKGWGDESKVKD
jgi:hypothetical protein